jgi:arsenate reductase (glutaredoxin)
VSPEARKFFAVLTKADAFLAITWWLILILRGVLPAAFAVAVGTLVGAVERGGSLSAALTFVGIVFVLLQVLTPIHRAVSANLGDRTAAWLYDRLTELCVRPLGLGHLENPSLSTDLTVARDFDAGMTGPPLQISVDFIANGLVEFIGGIACAAVLFAFAWWAPIVLAGAWLATHWLLRESGVDFEKVNYYIEPLGEQKLRELIKKMAIKPRELLRTGESIYRELELGKKQSSDDELIELMVKHPDLIQRPIVEKGNRAILARPAERLKESL